MSDTREVIDGGLSWDDTIAGLTIWASDGSIAATVKVGHYPPEKAARAAFVDKLGEFLGLVTFATQSKPEPEAGVIPPDPEGQNNDRAEWAEAALRHFQCTTGTEYEDAISDLLGDLMHACDRRGIRFATELDRAAGHYVEETDRQGRQAGEATA